MKVKIKREKLKRPFIFVYLRFIFVKYIVSIPMSIKTFMISQAPTLMDAN